MADIRWVNWEKLRAAGFEGCVFDKDNTLTEPYQLEVHPHARDSLARCKAAFDGKLVLYSNSAGLAQFDPDGACQLCLAGLACWSASPVSAMCVGCTALGGRSSCCHQLLFEGRNLAVQALRLQR